jgi:rod shape-determining protein MreC
MQNLINLFVKYHNFFLFLLLQVVSFFLIIRYHEQHREIFFSGFYAVAGYTYEQRTNIVNYFRLKDINQELLIENARLRAAGSLLLQNSPTATSSPQSSNDTTDYPVDTIAGNIPVTPGLHYNSGDTLFDGQYTYIPAYVVNNSVNRPNNYLTLNKGQLHGVPFPAAVITSRGIAGVVTHISGRYSAGMSVLHQNFSLSVKVLETGNIGSLVWEGTRPDRLVVQYSPRHKNIQPGQKIVTSPYSRLFPENIPVGTIIDYEIDPVSNFYIIEIEPAVNFRDLRFAYIVRNNLAGEQFRLENLARQW